MKKVRTTKAAAPTTARTAAKAAAAPAAVKKPNARDLQKEATRNAILQAALQIFSEHGFEGGSTRDIAARAKVHHALIKYYFKSKEALWKEAVTYLFVRQAEELAFSPPPGALESSKGRREHAQEVLRRVVLYSAHHPEHARLMVQESVRDSKRLRWAADTYIKRTGQAAASLVSLLQKENMLPPHVSPVALIYIIVGAAQLFYTLAPEVRRVWGIDPDQPEAIEAHVEALLAVFTR